jgi:hypothetical protein
MDEAVQLVGLVIIGVGFLAGVVSFVVCELVKA